MNLSTKKKITLGAILLILAVVNANDSNLLGPFATQLIQLPLFTACLILIVWRKRREK